MAVAFVGLKSYFKEIVFFLKKKKNNSKQMRTDSTLDLSQK